MNLAEALDLKPGECLAFVGAGGKTSAMFALAHDLTVPVVLTTSTHLGAWQAGLADEHHIVLTPEDLQSLKFDQHRIVLLTGPAGEDERLAGLNQHLLGKLQALCKQQGLPLLIESDGARQRSLKAPAVHEPAIPDDVDQVVVIAGITGLNNPLDDTVVHRPEIFSEITSLPLGDPIQSQNLVTLLRSTRGGLKNIPQTCHKFLFLNQADGAVLQAKAGWIAQRLVGFYDRVLVGSLHQPEQFGAIFSVHAQTAGIILAAGGSERLGHPKQMLMWQGKPFIVQVVQNALAAGLTPLMVITGADHALIEAALCDLPVTCVHNPEWSTGQSTSMKKGLDALPKDCDSAMFLLSDQPQVSALLIRQILERYAEKRAPITAPMVGSQRGNPVLFSRATFEVLQGISGDQGGRAVFSHFMVDWLPWVDERILMDVDEDGDEDSLRRAYFQT